MKSAVTSLKVATLAATLTSFTMSGARATSGVQGGAGSGRVPNYPGYELVWADEFDRDGEPDAKNWTYEHGFVRNQELQWYRPENARVAGGLLKIEARRERVPNPNFKSGSSDWR